MLLVNTFDVEPWWATVPPCVGRHQWNDLPDRSGPYLERYLDLCDQAGVRCTFFFVGWYARKFPDRVANVVRRGHEVGCHSLQHEDVAELGLDEFELNTRHAKEMIEDAGGAPVLAYRAPSFSFPVDRCGDFFRVLGGLGFRIDSSISTARRIHGGGFAKADYDGPVRLRERFDVDVFEIPVPGVRLAGREVQLFGGGYMRLAPSILLRQIARHQPYQVLYLHPHDFDEELPRLPGKGLMSNLRRRINVGKLDRKVIELFSDAQVMSCGQVLERHSNFTN
jgi:polysaccharide deacetylase family protein (PEP-CTERM system associated)